MDRHPPEDRRVSTKPRAVVRTFGQRQRRSVAPVVAPLSLEVLDAAGLTDRNGGILWGVHRAGTFQLGLSRTVLPGERTPAIARDSPLA